MQYVNLEVVRDPVEKVTAKVPVYAKPILQAIYLEDNVIDHGVEDCPPPKDITQESEYDRLERLYGDHPDSGMSWVSMIYGRIGEGRFEKAYNAAMRKAQSGETKSDIAKQLIDWGFDVPGNANKGDLEAMRDQIEADLPDMKEQLTEMGVEFSDETLPAELHKLWTEAMEDSEGEEAPLTTED